VRPRRDFFGEHVPGVRTLRDVTPRRTLKKFGGQLPAVIQKRCRHVLTENSRVLQAANALQSGNVHLFGRLMASSHASLRDDFEVSCEELELMVGLARQNRGLYGARMTGGGFWRLHDQRGPGGSGGGLPDKRVCGL